MTHPDYIWAGNFALEKKEVQNRQKKNVIYITFYCNYTSSTTLLGDGGDWALGWWGGGGGVEGNLRASPLCINT